MRKTFLNVKICKKYLQLFHSDEDVMWLFGCMMLMGDSIRWWKIPNKFEFFSTFWRHISNINIPIENFFSTSDDDIYISCVSGGGCYESKIFLILHTFSLLQHHNSCEEETRRSEATKSNAIDKFFTIFFFLLILIQNLLLDVEHTNLRIFHFKLGWTFLISYCKCDWKSVRRKKKNFFLTFFYVDELKLKWKWTECLFLSNTNIFSSFLYFLIKHKIYVIYNNLQKNEFS